MELCVDHLVLLVGDNPLPLALAVDGFSDFSLVSLVHSTETLRVARRLESWVERHRRRDARCYHLAHPTSPADAYEVCLRVIREGASLIGGSPFLCVDYTGGTKVMAAQARRAACRAQAEGLAARVVFSYLDYDATEWVVDHESPTGLWEAPRVNGLPSSFHLSLNDIVTIHGRKIIRLRRRPVLPESASALARALVTEQSHRRWRDWKAKWLRPLLEESDLRLPEERLGAHTLKLPAHLPLADSLARELKAGSVEGLPLGRVAGLCNLGPLDFCRWLDGGWLESYVFNLLSALAPNLSITDCCLNLSSVPDGTGGEVGDAFEVDVAGVVGGFRLVVLSCTTDRSKGMAKQKLLELSSRARQLGGGRAAFGLVSSCPDGRLLTELRGLAEQRSCSVFNVCSPTFEAELQQWLSGVALGVEGGGNGR